MGQLDGIERAADEVIEENDRLHIALATAKDRGDWWQDACEKSTKREEKLTAAVYDSSPMVNELEQAVESQKRAIKALEANLEAMKAEKCRYQREVNNMRQKLAGNRRCLTGSRYWQI